MVPLPINRSPNHSWKASPVRDKRLNLTKIFSSLAMVVYFSGGLSAQASVPPPPVGWETSIPNMTRLANILQGTWKRTARDGDYESQTRIQAMTFGPIIDHLIIVERSCSAVGAVNEKECFDDAYGSTIVSAIAFNGSSNEFTIYSPSLMSQLRSGPSQSIETIFVKFLGANHVMIEQKLVRGLILSREINGNIWVDRFRRIDDESKFVGSTVEYIRDESIEP